MLDDCLGLTFSVLPCSIFLHVALWSIALCFHISPNAMAPSSLVWLLVNAGDDSHTLSIEGQSLDVVP